MKKLILCSLFIGASYALAQSKVWINEVMSSNQNSIQDEDGNFSDWIELYNSGETEADLTGMYLSDDKKKLNKWTFPYVVIPAKGYLLIWASGKDRIGTNGEIHTNFSISADGEKLILTDYYGKAVDSTEVPSLSSDKVYCRIPDGTANFLISATATPRKSNLYSGYLSPPVFSKQGGLYDDPFKLSLAHHADDAQIIYTLDGSEPSVNNIRAQAYYYKNSYRELFINSTGKLLEGKYQSYLYQNEIDIKNIDSEENRIANIATSYHNAPKYFPKKPIKKCVVVKAIAYKDGISSDVVTNSYFIGDASYFKSPISIISLSTNDTNMFDFERGIYISGVDFEKWRNENPLLSIVPVRPANFNRRGDEYEYPIHFEMYNSVTKSKELGQNLGFRIHGSSTRIYPQKSFRLYARKEYGHSNLKYNFFNDKENPEYKRIILRSYYMYRAGDTFFPAMIKHLNLDVQLDRPCVVYLNGEYYGLFEMKERFDKQYLARKYGIDGDNIDYLGNNQVVEEDDNIHYQNMLNFIKNNSVANTNNYKKLQEMMDIDNYIDYQSVQIYSGNSDWPINNVDFWRLRTDYKPNAPYGHDGRWRWLVFDMDYAFGLIDNSNCTANSLEAAIGNGTHWSNILFFSLLKNTEFKNKFINRSADLINTTFKTDRLVQIINEKSAAFDPYVREHSERWSVSGYNGWRDKIEHALSFVQCRNTEMLKQIQGKLQAGSPYQFTVDVNEPESGNIVKINTIEISPETVGINEPAYPWTGQYFSAVPVTITAIPARGYVFSHWEGMPSGTPATFTKVFTENTSLVAHFKELEAFVLNYHSGAGGYLLGDTIQKVISGESGTPVTAVSYDGFRFVEWSDGKNNNPRTDKAKNNLNIQAVFSVITTENSKLKDQIFLYPNPFEQTLFINVAGSHNNITYRLYQMNGVMVKSGLLCSGKNSIDTSSLISGVYLLEMNSGDDSSLVKVLKY